MRITVYLMRQINSLAKAAFQDVVKSYEEAVRTLNTLQSNAAVIEKVKKERNENKHLNLPQTVEFASRIGLSLDDLDQLSVIHVSGTKGKGSTCAFAESVLRSHGVKTGFFSSPHLVEVRERIRINGEPLSREAFSSYFWDCYKSLDDTKSAHGDSMPAYFKFLTLMAFHVFLKEKVDVAIIEVGIGGQYDCTNILRHPVACGVSSLGMDHMSILGDTIDKIAWNKAGIFKPRVPAFTVPQPANSIQVIIDRAKEIGCPLWLAPEIDDYDWNSLPINLGIQGKMQRINASLALQLCRIWLQDHNKSIEERQSQYRQQSSAEGTAITIAPTMSISNHIYTGLSNCKWPGRNQTIKKPGVTYYIDGAHTFRSIQQCVEWFLEEANMERSRINGKVARVLVFNTTGDRKPETLLKVVKNGEFDCAAFCPNIATLSTDSADQTNFTVTLESQLSRCRLNKETWLKLNSKTSGACSDLGLGEGIGYEEFLDPEETPTKRTRTESESHTNMTNGDVTQSGNSENSHAGVLQEHAQTFNSIQDALSWAGQGRDPGLQCKDLLTVNAHSLLSSADHIQILCTGSLHLIGGVMRLLNPDLNN